MKGRIKFNQQKVGFFRYKRLKNNNYLLTNDGGEFVILSSDQFKKLLEGKIMPKSSLYPVLQEQGLIRDQLNFSDLISQYQNKNFFLFQGPTLHIIVITLRCNFKCVYCHASSRPPKEKGYDMDKKTAQKTADIILRSPSRYLAIEFQGGEPLLNWPVVKFIVEYVKKKNKIFKKDIEFRLVSNFSQMDDKKMKFLSKNNVTLCTSLDGPERIHNTNRVWTGGNNYKTVVKWLTKAQKLYKKRFKPAALTTISRYSLKYPKEIVDEFIKRRLENIFIRPLNPLGFAKKLEQEIGYPAEEYLDFYKKVLNYTIEYAIKHPESPFRERYAIIMLKKILADHDPNYLELRSPCGAGIGQLLYNYDGKVYTCDEGRMLGEDTFCLGDVRKDSYENIISHPTVKKMCLVSNLEGLTCDFCVYKPYCGVCPIYNYATLGSIFSAMPANEKCKINKGIFDFLFEKLQNKKIRKLFEKWIKHPTR